MEDVTGQGDATGHWSAMYIGVSDFLLGGGNLNQGGNSAPHLTTDNVPDNNKDINNLNLNLKATNSDSDGSGNSNEDGNGDATRSALNEQKQHIAQLLAEQADLRQQVLSFAAPQLQEQQKEPPNEEEDAVQKEALKKERKARRMSTLDHEVLHAALTSEISSLRKKLHETETSTLKTITRLHNENEVLNSNIIELRDLIRNSENEKMNLRNDLASMELTIVEYEEMVKNTKSKNDEKNQKKSGCMKCFFPSKRRKRRKSLNSGTKKNRIPKRRPSKKEFDGLE